MKVPSAVVYATMSSARLASVIAKVSFCRQAAQVTSNVSCTMDPDDPEGIAVSANAAMVMVPDMVSLQPNDVHPPDGTRTP